MKIDQKSTYGTNKPLHGDLNSAGKQQDQKHQQQDQNRQQQDQNRQNGQQQNGWSTPKGQNYSDQGKKEFKREAKESKEFK